MLERRRRTRSPTKCESFTATIAGHVPHTLECCCRRARAPLSGAPPPPHGSSAGGEREERETRRIYM
jgi:hypothetical protein